MFKLKMQLSCMPDGSRVCHMLDFFISYNQADRDWAEWIAWQLEGEGFKTVVQAWDFHRNFIQEMDMAVRQAERTIAVLSPAYFSSLFTQPEWYAAFAQDPTGEKGKLILVRVRECVLTGLLAPLNYADLVGCDDERIAKERLLAWVKGLRAKPPEPPIFPGSARQKLVFPQAVAPQPDAWPDFTVFRDAQSAPEMVVLPKGEFLMGQDDKVAAASEKPQHRVHFAYRLAVSQYPVTFDEWDTYVTDGGTDYRPNDQDWGYGRRPVIHVSWYEAKQYVTWLSQKTGQAYRLLSEAEWEYAARAGTTMRRWWGNEITPQNANYEDSKIGKTTEVGSYPESPFKLYDMIGNVWEWVEDCWNESYDNAPKQGEAWTTGDCSQRVLRGGSWKNGWWCVRSACRGSGPPGTRDNDVGFRVARTF